MGYGVDFRQLQALNNLHPPNPRAGGLEEGGGAVSPPAAAGGRRAARLSAAAKAYLAAPFEEAVPVELRVGASAPPHPHEEELARRWGHLNSFPLQVRAPGCLHARTLARFDFAACGKAEWISPHTRFLHLAACLSRMGEPLFQKRTQRFISPH